MLQANSLKDKQQSVLATLDAFLQSRPTPAAEARNMNGGLAPSATLPPHYLSEIHVVWKQLAPTMAWLFSKIASLRRVKPPIQAIQQQLQPVTPRCTAAAQTDPQKGMHDLQSALDRARSETQRIETFWRISLLDLAQAIDVCKALQGKLDARDKSLMPRQHFKSDVSIELVAVRKIASSQKVDRLSSMSLSRLHCHCPDSTKPLKQTLNLPQQIPLSVKRQSCHSAGAVCVFRLRWMM